MLLAHLIGALGVPVKPAYVGCFGGAADAWSAPLLYATAYSDLPIATVFF
jgi:hypothetical protein